VRYDTREASEAVEIEEGWFPNVHVSLDLVGEGPARLLTRSGARPDRRRWPPVRPVEVQRVSASVELAVGGESRRLAVTVEPRRERLRPRETAELRVGVRDASGRALAGAEVALAVMDDAILSLTDYVLADPLKSLALVRPGGVGVRHLDESRLFRLQGRIDPWRLEALGYFDRSDGGFESGVEGGVVGGIVGGMPGARQAQEVRRYDFRPLACFVPAAVTDAEGRVTLPCPLPDSLTRYRVMVVATDGATRFGTGEASLSVDLPSSLRPSPPRFLNRGDRAVVPLVVANRTASPLLASVAIQASGIRLSGTTAYRMTIAPKDRVELRFPVEADRRGTARFSAVLRSSAGSDAVDFSFPVHEPAQSEVFATSGVVDAEAVSLRLRTPERAVPGHGGLDIALSASALAELGEAFVSVVRYPHECGEQLATRVLLLAALVDLVEPLGVAELSDRQALAEFLRKDVEKLAALQGATGGFSYWAKTPTDPFVSLHAAHALLRAREAGFRVPEALIDGVRRYLRTTPPPLPEGVRKEERWTLEAYRLHVRHLAKDHDLDTVDRLLGETGSRVPPEVAAWLLPVTARGSSQRERLRQSLLGRVVESADSASIADEYRQDDFVTLSSERRTEALVLAALVDDDATDPLLPKLVRGLLGQRVKGQWRTTQENGFVLLALGQYFRRVEGGAASVRGRVLLGRKLLAAADLGPEGPSTHVTPVPLSALGAPGLLRDLVVEREGTGRLYYRLSLRYAMPAEGLSPVERGFSLTRRYEEVSSRDAVKRDPDGTWRIRAGSRVRVSVTLRTMASRHHVALVCPLPAGLEVDRDADRVDSRRSRDDRYEVFFTELPAGESEVSFQAVATTPGRFLAPPPKAEEMYVPETFGRGGTDRIIVE
jgi:hypothetical protein